jgi:riboflavin kinase/FMN adenylyltransferase
VPVYGMMNIGNNPTVNGDKQSIEVHFFNFNQDIYGKKVQVELLSRLRNEQKFGSIDALKSQLDKDKKNSLNFIEQLNA